MKDPRQKFIDELDEAYGHYRESERGTDWAIIIYWLVVLVLATVGVVLTAKDVWEQMVK